MQPAGKAGVSIRGQTLVPDTGTYEHKSTMTNLNGKTNSNEHLSRN